MTITVQLTSLLFSLIYGMIFCLLVKINYKFIYCSPIILKILINLLFVIDNVLIYFIILKKINGGIVHIAFLIMILTGFVISKLIINGVSFDFKIKKWYNPS